MEGGAMSNKPRIPDYAECVTFLSEQGLDDGSPSASEDEPEHDDPTEYDGETVAVQCGPLVGLYRVGRRHRARPRAAAVESRPPVSSDSPDS
jgi:hypothetical protein